MTLPRVIKVLLWPAWLLALAAALIELDVLHVVSWAEELSETLGSATLVAAFVVPLTTLVASLPLVWHTMKNLKGGPGSGLLGLWLRFGAACIVIVATWALMFRIFGS